MLPKLSCAYTFDFLIQPSYVSLFQKSGTPNQSHHLQLLDDGSIPGVAGVAMAPDEINDSESDSFQGRRKWFAWKRRDETMKLFGGELFVHSFKLMIST